MSDLRHRAAAAANEIAQLSDAAYLAGRQRASHWLEGEYRGGHEGLGADAHS